MSIEIKNTYKSTQTTLDAEILSGQTSTGYVDLGGMQLRGLLFPATWTDCDVTFETSLVPDTYPSFESFNTKNFDGVDSILLSIPTVASDDVPLYAHWFDQKKYIKITCSVAQAVDTKVILVLQPLYQGVHG